MSRLLALAVSGGVAVLLGAPGYAQQTLPPPFEPPPLPSPSSVPISVSSPSLRLGDSGNEVAALQNALSINGFNPGPIDGAYGPLTLGAVESFQREYDLPVTGVAGPDTLDVLGLYDPDSQTIATGSQSSSLRYVAAITESRRKLPRAQQSFRNATLDSARQGEFINIGRYGSYSAAADRVRDARRLGFDARILYKR
ncbi:MAG: peptidoglycan-binding domain-containing protein [Cyanobacteria bacterium P01_D01_bin.156]